MSQSINKLFDVILENKKILKEFNLVQLSKTNYSNVKFDNDATKYDKVNTALLDDLQRAASSVGIIATITTAKSGHSEYTTSKNKSRHTTGAGVDIGLLNGIGSGGATNSINGNENFRVLGDKLADALESLGYKRNVESGNEKSVLWQTNTGGNHYNHLHVSNNSGQSSDSNLQTSGENEDVMTSEPQSDERYSELDNTSGGFIYNIAKGLAKDLKLDESVINESRYYSNFGKNAKENYGYITIPQKDNSVIRSVVSGKVDLGKINLNCNNQLVIKFTQNKDVYYLEYCGMKTLNFTKGDSVSSGDVLGDTSSDVDVTLYNSRFKKIDISNFGSKSTNTNTKSDDEPVYSKGTYGPKTDIAKFIMAPFSLFQNEYDLTGGTVTKNYALPTDKMQPDPFWKTKSFKKNVQRIKNLMK